MRKTKQFRNFTRGCSLFTQNQLPWEKYRWCPKSPLLTAVCLWWYCIPDLPILTQSLNPMYEKKAYPMKEISGRIFVTCTAYASFFWKTFWGILISLLTLFNSHNCSREDNLNYYDSHFCSFGNVVIFRHLKSFCRWIIYDHIFDGFFFQSSCPMFLEKARSRKQNYLVPEPIEGIWKWIFIM